KIHSAVVRRHVVCVDNLHAVFPGVAAGRIPVLAPAVDPVEASGTGSRPYYFAGCHVGVGDYRCGAVESTYPAGDELETGVTGKPGTARARGTGDCRWPVVPGAQLHRAADAKLVCAVACRRVAVSAVCLVQPR